jgi:hypothetical protein
MTLGNYSTKYGTANNDTITGNIRQVLLGIAGNDRLTAGGSPNGSAVGVLAGGLGDDTYTIPTGQGAVILESGGNDTVVFPFSGISSTQVVGTIDNRHLFIGDTASLTFATIIDWQNPAN